MNELRSCHIVYMKMHWWIGILTFGRITRFIYYFTPEPIYSVLAADSQYRLIQEQTCSFLLFISKLLVCGVLKKKMACCKFTHIPFQKILNCPPAFMLLAAYHFFFIDCRVFQWLLELHFPSKNTIPILPFLLWQEPC